MTFRKYETFHGSWAVFNSPPYCLTPYLLYEVVEKNWLFVTHIIFEKLVVWGIKNYPYYDNVNMGEYPLYTCKEEIVQKIKFELLLGDPFYDPAFDGTPDSHSSVYGWYHCKHERRNYP